MKRGGCGPRAVRAQRVAGRLLFRRATRESSGAAEHEEGNTRLCEKKTATAAVERPIREDKPSRSALTVQKHSETCR